MIQHLPEIITYRTLYRGTQSGVLLVHYASDLCSGVMCLDLISEYHDVEMALVTI
jgi:hypothetical protein